MLFISEHSGLQIRAENHSMQYRARESNASIERNGIRGRRESAVYHKKAGRSRFRSSRARAAFNLIMFHRHKN